MSPFDGPSLPDHSSHNEDHASVNGLPSSCKRRRRPGRLLPSRQKRMFENARADETFLDSLDSETSCCVSRKRVLALEITKMDNCIMVEEELVSNEAILSINTFQTAMVQGPGSDSDFGMRWITRQDGYLVRCHKGIAPGCVSNPEDSRYEELAKRIGVIFTNITTKRALNVRSGEVSRRRDTQGRPDWKGMITRPELYGMRLNVLEYLRQATGLGNNATDMLSVLVWRKANSVQGPAAWASDAVEKADRMNCGTGASAVQAMLGSSLMPTMLGPLDLGQGGGPVVRVEFATITYCGGCVTESDFCIAFIGVVTELPWAGLRRHHLQPGPPLRLWQLQGADGATLSFEGTEYRMVAVKVDEKFPGRRRTSRFGGVREVFSEKMSAQSLGSEEVEVEEERVIKTSQWPYKCEI
ncbi:hypothetical protein BGZ61DRAFT_484519 [Ilyonectria robusta]|uniref:uncharacterized protein n=1 Tax=Ilyonectria robusta TaxID=1079257 RepID=UPI001E8EC5C3|nr:uncharacterized protein BGZ61DRAFT_484519 [Ilyonectria robusta]KAH8665427.1 hypothetical protein BGZ61DRAFT_484519 [Ilyonectria robusta]